MSHTGQIYVVYGPQGCGKTRYSKLLSKHYHAPVIIDGATLSGYHYNQAVQATKVGSNVLLLTNVEMTKEIVGRLIDRYPSIGRIEQFSLAMGEAIHLLTEESADRLDELWQHEETGALEMAATLETLADNIHAQNVKVGWWDELEGLSPRFRKMLFAEKMALVHSEVTEALEGLRKDQMDDKLPWRTMAEVEISDAIIRLLDLAKGMGLEVGAPLIEKLAFNSQRADHKRENREAPGGKAF